jgi:hypothetical protein
MHLIFQLFAGTQDFSRAPTDKHLGVEFWRYGWLVMAVMTDASSSKSLTEVCFSTCGLAILNIYCKFSNENLM